MRITFVLPYAGLAGGVRVVANYAERLQKRGHLVTVISLPPRPFTLKHKLKTLLKERRWPHREHGPTHFERLHIEHRVLEKYRPITDADLPDADVVIATWWETAEWVNLLKPSKGKKVYFVQGHDVREGIPIERVQATYLMPFQYIAVSKWLSDILTQDYKAQHVHLISNSVDSDFFNGPEREKGGTPTLGFMYSPARFKGCDICIEALNRARSKMPALRIIAFGAALPSDQLPLPENTEFYCRPPQEKIRDIYSSCDFWLFGSRAEGFGLPILEAMACRTPVIATMAGAAQELVPKGGGVLIKDWKASSMAEAIISSLQMPPEKWKQLSQNARQTACGYSWDDATDLFERALLRLF